MFIQISWSVLPHIQILLIRGTGQLVWQRVVRLKPLIIRLIEFELCLVDRRPWAILLEPDCSVDDFLKWPNYSIICFDTHFVLV